MKCVNEFTIVYVYYIFMFFLLSEVQTLPVIKSPLKNIRCCDGDAVTFICKIDATPPPSIRWEKGGKVIRISYFIFYYRFL